ncbi:LysR family transcriptional regulator [Luteibacter jiangsuensis]|uniref:LysR family transcriptional regulator n=2 Tax=Luteibacter jiangsuensis TaxID=637577 RepID=A0ABX0Q2D3_9GAMM|nr:LysR family transcriptional regulator [Luteibacter jiangsuensis]
MGGKKTPLELRHFAALVALAEAGGVGKAARRLGVAQSTLSEALLSLERALGHPVLERMPGASAALTEVARRLLPHARSILLATERAHAEALAMPVRLVVGTVESVGTHLLPMALHACRSAHPQLELQVSVGLCETLKASFAAGRIDLLLTLERARTRSSRSAIPAHSIPLMLLREAEDTSPIEDTWPLLVPDPEGALHAAARDWVRREGVSRHVVSTGTLDGVRRGVCSGRALGFLPRHAVLDDLRVGRLSTVNTRGALPSLELRVRLRRSVPAALREGAGTVTSAVSKQLVAEAMAE